jgi:hypothetical protein
MMDSLPGLDVFYGDLTVNRAFVYARLPRLEGDLFLAGQVRGPRCLHAETLPLTSPLVDLGPGPTLLARALVPDPVFWSPDLPAIYDVTVNLLRGTEVIASERREIGLRSFGVRGQRFYLEGKPWVLRGVRDRSTTAKLPRAWHEFSAAYVASSESNENVAEASQFGALAVVEVAAEDAPAGLRRLALQPGVALAVIRGDLPPNFKRSDVAPNLLLVQVTAGGEPLIREPWADALLIETADPLLVARIAPQAGLPVLVSRPLQIALPIDQARAACDSLQRDLAPHGQFAGYIV